MKAAESVWRFSLRQHNWQRLDNDEAKQLYLHLSSVTISEFDLSVENDKTCIEHEHYEKKYRMSDNILPIMTGVKKYKMRRSSENMFFDKRNRTHRIIMQMLPKEERSFAQYFLIFPSFEL